MNNPDTNVFKEPYSMVRDSVNNLPTNSRQGAGFSASKECVLLLNIV